MSGDLLGASKNLGQGQQDRGSEYVHGVRNLTNDDEWNAARCIHGVPTEKELQPDRDLGKAVKPGCRNVVRSDADKTRSFGLPTVRNDIPYKAWKGLANF